MARSRLITFTLLSLASLMGCLAGPQDEPTGSDLAALNVAGGTTAATVDPPLVGPCASLAPTDIPRSLVVTEPAILASFTFSRVMNAIRASASVNQAEDVLAVYRRWMNTFGSDSPGGCNDAKIDPNDYGLVCPRPNEQLLAGVDPFEANASVRFEPVAIFNRFDLAPSNGANCGEYRIVFAMRSSSFSLQGRAFIIFEAALPNPNPTQGINACLPVARFWQELSSDPSVTSRAAKLDSFYFGGNAIAGFPPAVRAAHYGISTNAGGSASGQIRTNFFINNNTWHLREFKTNRQCLDASKPATCTLAIAHVPAKANPAEELFAGTHPRSAAFRTAFVGQIPALSSTDVTRIKLSTSNTFNEFESVSQAFNVVYKDVGDDAMRSAIATKVAGKGLTIDNILDRATTQTCAGCHQVSNGASLGQGLRWPSSNGFVHVNESGGLSEALVTKFLPARKATLDKYLQARCAQIAPGTASTLASPAPALVVGETLGGSPVGAAN